MAHAFLSVPGTQAIFTHPGDDGSRTGRGLLRLEQAGRRGYYVMTAGAVKACGGAFPCLAHGVYRLVAIALHTVRADYALRTELQAAYAAEGLVHALELHRELRGVAHVHEVAAAAAAEIRAGGRDTLGRARQALLPPAVNGGFSHLDYPHAPALPRKRPRHEHGAAGYPAHARTLGGKARHFCLIYFVFLQIVHAPILTRRARGFNAYQKICNLQGAMLSYLVVNRAARRLEV